MLHDVSVFEVSAFTKQLSDGVKQLDAAAKTTQRAFDMSRISELGGFSKLQVSKSTWGSGKVGDRFCSVYFIFLGTSGSKLASVRKATNV